MENILVKVLIWVLGVNTIRNIIAFIGIVPRDKKYSWIIYGRYDFELTKKVFREIGIGEERIRRVVTILKANWEFSEVHNLLALLSRYVIRTDRELTYGEATPPVTSRYYIDTMEVSHDDEDLKTMVGIMTNLVAKEIGKGHTTYDRYDFVITPKGGNPIFGKRFAETNGKYLILRKDDRDRSRAKVDLTDYRARLLINFEGFQKIPRDKKLAGIAMDCNASDCSQIVLSIEEFNECVRNSKAKEHIEPVQDAFILFRPDNVNDNIDNDLASKHIKLHRILDFNEEGKAILTSWGKLDLTRKADVKKIEKFMIAFRNLIKVETKTAST